MRPGKRSLGVRLEPLSLFYYSNWSGPIREDSFSSFLQAVGLHRFARSARADSHSYSKPKQELSSCIGNQVFIGLRFGRFAAIIAANSVVNKPASGHAKSPHIPEREHFALSPALFQVSSSHSFSS